MLCLCCICTKRYVKIPLLECAPFIPCFEIRALFSLLSLYNVFFPNVSCLISTLTSEQFQNCVPFLPPLFVVPLPPLPRPLLPLPRALPPLPRGIAPPPRAFPPLLRALPPRQEHRPAIRDLVRSTYRDASSAAFPGAFAANFLSELDCSTVFSSKPYDLLRSFAN